MPEEEKPECDEKKPDDEKAEPEPGSGEEKDVTEHQAESTPSE